MRSLIYILAALFGATALATSARPGMLGVSSARFVQDASDRANLTRYTTARDKIYDPNEALGFLRRVKHPSPFQPWALLESARWLYKSARWSEFFGVASYARQVHPEAPQTRKIALLESLALMRHCQWGKALGLLEVETEVARGAAKDHGETLKAIVELIRDLPKENVDRERPLNYSPGVPMAYRWSAKRLELARLDPYRLRRPVAPLCEKTAVAE